MLTRRQQLKLKQDQKEQKEQKGKAKDADPEAVPDAKHEKGDKKVKAKSAPKAEPKAKGKAKAKAKSEGKAKAQPKKRSRKEDEEADKEDEESQEPDAPKTPEAKRRLFHESDDDMNEGDEKNVASGSDAQAVDPALKKYVDPKTGKEVSLQELFDNYIPNKWKRHHVKPSTDADEGEESTRAGKPKAKAKARGKAKAKAKAAAAADAKEKAKSSSPGQALSSPSIKKEQKRRKKKETAVIETTGEEMADTGLQSVFVHMIESVSNFESDDTKHYLKANMSGGNKLCNLSAYWHKLKEGSCGVMKKTGATWVYFGFKHDVDWNVNMTLAYMCGSKMVSCLEQWLLDGCLCWSVYFVRFNRSIKYEHNQYELLRKKTSEHQRYKN